MRKLLAATVLLSAMSATQVHASECGKVTIADMNWNSATLLANVDSFILQHGYGCETDLVPGDTMPTGTSMVEKGEPDIAPEFWSNSMKAALDRGVEEGRIQYAGTSFSDGGEEGFWVPEYMVKKDPSLATIEGIRRMPSYSLIQKTLINQHSIIVLRVGIVRFLPVTFLKH